MCPWQVESFDEVERAFVHVDYEEREEPEHKVRDKIKTGQHSLALPITRPAVTKLICQFDDVVGDSSRSVLFM